MAYRVQDLDGIFEVNVWGETSKQELLGAVLEMHRRDPGKKCADLWLIDRECIVPFTDFHQIAEGIKSLCPPGMVGNKTALVADHGFQQAQIEMYRGEAAILPFEIRVFRSRSEAEEWLRRPATPPAASRGKGHPAAAGGPK